MEDKLLKAIDNIEQLSADMRYLVDINKYDLDVEIESIENWLKDVKRLSKKIRVENKM